MSRLRQDKDGKKNLRRRNQRHAVNFGFTEERGQEQEQALLSQPLVREGVTAAQVIATSASSIVPSSRLPSGRQSGRQDGQYRRRGASTQRRGDGREEMIVPQNATLNSRRRLDSEPVVNKPLNTHGFTFQFLRYPSVFISEGSMMAGVSAEKSQMRNIVYFNRNLDFERNLILRIESVSSAASVNDWGFIIGFTSCEPTRVYSNRCHFSEYCRPNKECGGVSLFTKIKSVDCRGICVEIERNPRKESLAKITIHRMNSSSSFEVKDVGNKVFRGLQKIYPFIDLNGRVTLMRIVDKVTPVELLLRPSVRHLSIDVSRESWKYNEDEVSVDKDVIAKNTSSTAPFILNRTPMQVNNTLTFVVSGVKEQDDEDVDSDDDSSVTYSSASSNEEDETPLTFGMTTIDPENVDIAGLPRDPFDLLARKYAADWYVVPDLLSGFKVTEGPLKLSIKRNMKGVTMKLDANGEIKNILLLDPAKIVYPFFMFSGCVNKITVVPDKDDSQTTVSRAERSVSESSASSFTNRSVCRTCLKEDLN